MMCEREMRCAVDSSVVGDPQLSDLRLGCVQPGVADGAELECAKGH